ncbi:MAG: ABC transporter ATP-binding protein [Candidatus Caenarcaniphilales bacterium]|nr:ABC transporter ATP-binding protein [Candidatus Caenarcaniphilales bacterium]
MSFIQLKNINKSYSELGKALSNVSMSIQRGELISLMGESGAGKTSLLNILGLIDNPSTGEYTFEGQSVSTFNEEQRTLFRREKLGFIFQFFNLLTNLNVTDNVAVPLHLNGIQSYKEAVREKLAQVGILELKDRPLNTLSGGQLQRVAIARAIVHSPKLILADEPTGNLDSKTTKDIMGLLVRLKKEENVTIVMATHSNQASIYADRVLNIIDGSLTPQ